MPFGQEPFFLEIMPHLIQLQLLIMLSGKRPDLVEHGLGRDPEEERDAVHGEATQVDPHGILFVLRGLPRGVVRVNWSPHG
jgi:hypothetical protein